MKNVTMNELPERTRRRLVQLTQLLAQLPDEQTLTSLDIEKMTGWSSSVIRHDISVVGCNCGASNGYRVKILLQHLKSALGHTELREKKCCIVGLGKLGEALFSSDLLSGTPFKIVAGFDASVNRTEVLKADFPLYPITNLEKIIKEESIKYAILTVPNTEAQVVAERLSGCGIAGIVNYTGIMLVQHENVAVENVSLITALSALATIEL